jgi:hypothetical protein
MKAPRETDLVRACLQLLRVRGVCAWRANSGALSVQRGGRRHVYRFAGVRGLSDILGILPPAGRFLAVECKMRGRKLTAHQQGFLDAIRAAGGVALVITDVGQLQAELTGLLCGPRP